MFKSRMVKGAAVALTTLLLVSCNGIKPDAQIGGQSQQADSLFIRGIGTAVSESDLIHWDISVYYDGDNLPEGSGTLVEGEAIWSTQCAMCHGDFGEGVKGYPKMFSAPREEFIQTAIENGFNVENRGINNMWAHAPTLYDMIRRAMPYFAPQSLSVDQSYSVTGYVLYLAEVIGDEVQTIDAELLRNLTMPNADLYYTDTRPDVANTRCMNHCRSEPPEVVGKQIVGDFDGIKDEE